MFFKNNKGFSLAEVLVAAGILGGLSLAVNQLVFNQNKSVKTVEKKFELISVASTIRTILSDREACHNTFGINAGPPLTGTYDPNNVAAGTITEIRNKNNDVMFESNVDENLATKIGNGQIKILSFSLSSADTAPIPANSTGITNFTIEFYRGNNIYGTDRISRTIQLNARTDASTNMIDCGTTAVNDVVVNTTSLCSAIGGTYDSSGRSGAGDCHSISPNLQTTLNGDLETSGLNTFNGNTIANGTAQFNADVIVNADMRVEDTFSIELVSDKRLKFDIEPLESTLDKIKLIEPVVFKWKKNSKKEIGFIAQNMAKAYPLLVSKTEKGLFAVKYPNAVAVAIGGIKEQQVQIEEMESSLNSLRQENQRLDSELKFLKNLLCKDKRYSLACD